MGKLSSIDNCVPWGNGVADAGFRIASDVRIYLQGRLHPITNG